MDGVLDFMRGSVRKVMGSVARLLNSVSGGKLHPNVITFIGLGAHVPIAWLIAVQNFKLAAILLIIFGLFDALDGELARLQKRASNSGMLLDASTDRMKEILLYIGCSYALVAMGHPYASFWAVAACGSSLLVSYIKAKGETAVAGQLPANEVNRLFQDGLMRFEIRMLILVLGLLSGWLLLALIVISLSSFLSALGRLKRINKQLAARHVQD